MDNRRLNDLNSTMVRCGFGPIGNVPPAWERLYDDLCEFADKERLYDKGVAAIDRGKSPSLASLEAWPALGEVCREKGIKLIGEKDEQIQKTTGRQTLPKDGNEPGSEETATVDAEGAS